MAKGAPWPTRELISAIRSALRAAADPARAGAQAYLKSEMPSLGVRVPEVRRIVKDAAKQLPPGSCQNCSPPCWSCGAAPAGGGTLRRHRPHGLRLAAGELSMLPLYEEIIRSGAWWDLVDGVSHRLCELLQSHRGGHVHRAPPLEHGRGLLDPEAAITAQLGAKSATGSCPARGRHRANLADHEFFIRKAIGWEPARLRRDGSGLGSNCSRRAARRGAEPALPPGSPAETQMTGRVVTGSSDLLKSSLVLGSRKIK